MGSSVKTAVVGTGFIGPVHVEALHRIGVADVVALVGSNQEATQRKADQLGVPLALTSLEDALAIPGLQAIHITTPNYLHGPMVKQAIAAGKHVICEKPLAMTAKEGEELLALAEAAGIVHVTNFNIRFYPLCHQARSLVQSGDLGDVHIIHGHYLQDWLLKPTDWNWRLEPEFSGEMRAVADIGSHWLDLTGFVTGQRITAVCADFATFLPIRKKPTRPLETFAGKELNPDEYEEHPIKTEDYATILLRYESGAHGVLTVSQMSAGRKNHLAFEVDGSKSSVYWCSEAPEELFIGQRDKPSESLLRDPGLLSPDARQVTSYPGGHAEGFPDTFKQLYRKVYAAIQHGGMPAEPEFPTFADGVRALRLGEAILQSARTEKWVEVD